MSLYAGDPVDMPCMTDWCPNDAAPMYRVCEPCYAKIEKALRPKWWRCTDRMAKLPMVATLLLEYANIGQLWRMWTERTAAGQELTSWIAVFLALVCYGWFYQVVLPEQKWARYANYTGICMNLTVVLTVLYFRHIA